MNAFKGKPMPVERFEFRVSPKSIPKKKKFQLDNDISKSANGVLPPPKLQRKLSKRKRNSEKANKTRKLFHNQQNWPVGVKGQTIDDSTNARRQKIKYHNTFSCSQTSLLSYASAQAQDITSLARGVTDLHSRKDQKEMLASATPRSINSYIEYVGPHPSLVSEKSSFLSGYDDEFFDILDLPGHFNTKGIYGQKVNPPNQNLTRARTDLYLEKIKPIQKDYRRQNTLLLTPIRTNLKLEPTTQKKPEKDLMFPTLQKSKLTTHSTFLDTPTREKTSVSELSFRSEKSLIRDTQRDKVHHEGKSKPMTKDQKVQHASDNVPTKSEQDLRKLNDKMEKYMVIGDKSRKSVDVMTQTDNDLLGFNGDEPLIDCEVLT